MILRFVGGPYDGMRREVGDCHGVMVFLEIPTRRGSQRFVMLPALADWLGVTRGLTAVRDSRQYHYYQMRVIRHPLICSYDHNACRYKQALFDSLSLIDPVLPPPSSTTNPS